jgi:hypothetical protein
MQGENLPCIKTNIILKTTPQNTVSRSVYFEITKIRQNQIETIISSAKREQAEELAREEQVPGLRSNSFLALHLSSCPKKRFSLMQLCPMAQLVFCLFALI